MSSMFFFLCSISVLLDPICKQVWVVNCTSPCRSHPSAQFQKILPRRVPDISRVFAFAFFLGRATLASQIKLADLGSCRGIYSRQPFTEPRLSFTVRFSGFCCSIPRFFVSLGSGMRANCPEPQTQSTPDSKPHVPSTLRA